MAIEPGATLADADGDGGTNDLPIRIVVVSDFDTVLSGDSVPDSTIDPMNKFAAAEEQACAYY